MGTSVQLCVCWAHTGQVGHEAATFLRLFFFWGLCADTEMSKQIKKYDRNQSLMD